MACAGMRLHFYGLSVAPLTGRKASSLRRDCVSHRGSCRKEGNRRRVWVNALRWPILTFSSNKQQQSIFDVEVSIGALENSSKLGLTPLGFHLAHMPVDARIGLPTAVETFGTSNQVTTGDRRRQERCWCMGHFANAWLPSSPLRLAYLSGPAVSIILVSLLSSGAQGYGTEHADVRKSPFVRSFNRTKEATGRSWNLTSFCTGKSHMCLRPTISVQELQVSERQGAWGYLSFLGY